MASVRSGNTSVLLIVDAQVGVVRDGFNADGIIANIAGALAKARAKNIPVIWVQHADEHLVHGSADWQIVPGLVPAKGEMLIDKHFNSAFEETGLEAHLAQLGATRIVLAGAVTIGCLRATAYAALDRGYDLTLLEDAHTMPTLELEPGLRIDAASVILDLNVTLRWLRYPGRSSDVVAVSQLEF